MTSSDRTPSSRMLPSVIASIASLKRRVATRVTTRLPTPGSSPGCRVLHLDLVSRRRRPVGRGELLDTMPSRPMRQACRKMVAPSRRTCRR